SSQRSCHGAAIDVQFGRGSCVSPSLPRGASVNRWNRPGFPALAEGAFGLAVVAFAAACAGPPERNDPAAPASPAATGVAAAGASDAQSTRASPSVRRLRGMYTLMADTGSFVECR